MEDITIEKVREKIKENLNKAKDRQLNIKNIQEDDNHNTAYSSDKVINVNDLLRLDGEQFIKEIYKNILLREPDAAGLDNYLKLIKKGVSKETILHTIATSAEASGKHAMVAGLESLDLGWKHRLRQKAKKIPVVSDLILWGYRFVKLPLRFQELSMEFTANKFDIVRRDRMIEEEFAKRDRMAEENFVRRDRMIEEEFARRERLAEENYNTLMNETIEKGKSINEMKGHLASIDRKLDFLNYELKKRAGIDIEQTIKEIANKDFSPQSYTYFAFENRFRGSRETIKERQLQYVKYAAEAYQNSKGDYVLDIGCGRGEFLEILSENNIPSKGIDTNEENINFCRGLNMNVELLDALKFMKSVKDDSLIGVTAFQVVEHLNTEYLMEFLKTSFQKIKEGGIIVLETVNPFSLCSLMNFFTDLTHRNPIPAITLKYIMEASGFSEGEIKYLSPIPDEMKLKGDDENIRRLNEMIFGFQEYAVIGKKRLL